MAASKYFTTPSPLLDTPEKTASFSQIVARFQHDSHDEPRPIMPQKIPRKTSVKRKVDKEKKPVKEKPRKALKEKVVKPPREKVPKPRVVREKKVKKKAQTITALATAPYKAVEVVVQTTIPEVLAIEEPTKKRKAKSTKTTSSKKVKVQEPRFLLPPSQAQGCLSNQTFIFGTSSQLHTEESPKALTDLQHALHESEISPRHIHDSPYQSRVRVPTAPHGTSLAIGQGNRDLWCVSARDHTGNTMVTEQVDETQTSCVDSVLESGTVIEKVLDIYNAPTTSTMPIAENGTSQTRAEDEYITISSDPAIMQHDQKTIQQVDNEPTDIVSLRPPWPSSQRAVLQPLDANQLPSSRQPRSKELPLKQQGRIPASLKEVIEIRSSPADKHKQASILTTPSKILETLHSSPLSEWHNIDEISDAEQPSPSPTRKRSTKSPQPSHILEFAITNEALHDEALPEQALPEEASREEDWSITSAKLYPQITMTIKAIPRSDSLKNPTWHEKILLYDPIVIEDLTSWLNAQGLRVAVKKKLKRSEKNPEAVHEERMEELSHWMVQKWCEDHSVCCLWKEGLRGGVRTRY